MLFAIPESGRRAAEKSRPTTVACVTAICLLAAAPLMFSISLTVWGG